MFDEEIILYFHLLNELNASIVLDRFGHPEHRCPVFVNRCWEGQIKEANV